LIGRRLPSALQPEGSGDFERIDIVLLPPLSFVTSRVDVVVVNGTERDCELVAHLQAESSRLRVADVVRMRGRASADETRLTCDKAQMLLGADALGLADGENALVDL
jgi:hypothetical protein